MGLKAKEIVNGLSGIGLGDVLKFSAIAGAFGLIGIAAFSAYSYFKNNNTDIIKREYILQRIIQHQQRTINVIIDDINYFSQRMIELINLHNNNMEEIEELKALISSYACAMQELNENNEKYLSYEEK